MAGESEEQKAQCLPLEGVHVLDLATVATGPIATRALADYGATVVRVESSTHPDTLRVSGPYGGLITGIDNSMFFAGYNSGKMSISLDMKQEASRSILSRLVLWADVVVESFTPRVLKDWGRGERGEFLRAVRDGACRFFGGVLSPDYNAAHANHFHFDMGWWKICG